MEADLLVPDRIASVRRDESMAVITAAHLQIHERD